MEPKQNRSMDMIPPRRTTPASRPSATPSRPRKEPPAVDLRTIEPITTAIRPTVPRPVAINAAPLQAAPAPRPAPVAVPPERYDDPLAEVEEIPAPPSVEKPVKRKRGFWRGFWKFLLVMVVLGLIASIAVFIYVSYNG